MQGSLPPSFAIKENQISLEGRWRLDDLQYIELDQLSPHDRSSDITIDCSRLESIDTGSLRLIFSKLRGSKFAFVNANSKMEQIFQLVLKAEKNMPEQQPANPLILARIGKGLWEGTYSSLVLLRFIGQTCIEQVQSFFSPKQIRFKELFIQLEQCGLNAVPVVSLVMFLIGTVVAYLFPGSRVREIPL